ncbi:MAG: peptidoglycan recognition family protein [Pseudomonadota bacterium]
MAHLLLCVDRGLRGASSFVSLLLLIMAVLVFWAISFLNTRARLASIPPPLAWAEAAGEKDRLNVEGHDIAYWANPDAGYANVATKRKKKPVAIVVHYTTVKPVLRLVEYGQRKDFSRGGGSYGYHFYVGRGGGIAQGAPLSKRTNHIKSSRRPQRTKTARHVWSGNTIGVSMVGGCDWLLRPDWPRLTICTGEYVTLEQLDAGLAVIRALQERYGILCEAVFGHGELQTDRLAFEGETLTKLARAGCAVTESIAEGPGKTG